MWCALLLLTQAIAPDPRVVPDPNRYLLVKKDVMPSGPLPLHAVAPAFPDELLASTQVTIVVVLVVVDRQGLVRRTTAVEGGDTKARKPALDAASQWVFEASVGGMAERSIRLSFTFRTLPSWAPPEEVTTVFSYKYDVEVRKVVRPGGEEP